MFVEDAIFELVFVNFGQVLRLLVSCSLGSLFLDRCQVAGLDAHPGSVFLSAGCHDGILLVYVLYLLLVVLVHHILVLLALFLRLFPFVDIHACKLDLALYLLVLSLEVVYAAFDLLLLICLNPKLLPCLPDRRHICEQGRNAGLFLSAHVVLLRCIVVLVRLLKGQLAKCGRGGEVDTAMGGWLVDEAAVADMVFTKLAVWLIHWQYSSLRLPDGP